MNVHHLELFYYVARYKGVSAASRRMPYGIQQPAISAQMMQLEDTLGTALFHRRPFALTQTGQDLYEYIEPFFSGLAEISQKLRGGQVDRLRIGAPETIQREYLPILLKRLKKHSPHATIQLVSARVDDIEQLLLDQAIDLGITALHQKRVEGIKHRELLRVPLCLLVPTKSGLTSAEKLWAQDRIDLPLISLPPTEPMCVAFQNELRRHKVEWFPTLELTSLELVARYVAEGFGLGLALSVPGAQWRTGVRALPLSGFDPLAFGALWLGSLSPIAQWFLDEASALAQELSRRPASA
jgi:DNA-binding transcriptional LysR family regulator